MTNRDAEIAMFLAGAGWQEAQRAPLAGDASSRRYERLKRPDGCETAIIMDAGPESEESVRRFHAIASHLISIGLSAPEVLAADHRARLLLLEDFGDGVFARLIERDKGLELPLYEAAIDVLVHLRETRPPTGLSCPGPKELAEFVTITQEWYASPGADVPGSDLISELQRLLELVETRNPVLSLRDYHSENLIWLHDRHGIKRVGLLDFQDAFLCHPAYDLASLLRDARRDLASELVERLFDRYLRATGADANIMRLAFAVLGAQRNLRILGVFARLGRQRGKPHYVGLVPRVWAHLMADLAHPALSHLREIVRAELPEPTEIVLNGLTSKCTLPPQV